MLEISKVLGDRKLYDGYYKKYYNRVIEDYQFRKKKIKLLFPDGSTKTFKIYKFLVNMVFWCPFVEFQETLTEDFIFDTNNINSDSIADYLDLIIDKFFISDKDHAKIINCLGEIITKLSYYSVDFNKRVGNTISLYNIINLMNTNEEFKEIIYTRFNEKYIDTASIEKELARRTKRLLEILSSTKNCFRDYVNAKEGLNKNQLTQFLINIGPKPDLKGNVFPKIVNTNFITDGFKSVSDYYINSSGGRKAAITNYSETKNSGYLMRKLSILCMNVDLSKEKDCGTQNYVRQTLDSESTMERFDKRYYVGKDGKLRLFKYNKDTAIKYKGRTLNFRSPITCNCKNGICKTCYGGLSKINFDIHIGIMAILILTSQLTQQMLSTKHLLKTDTKEIEWKDNFKEFFIMNGNTIELNPDIDDPSLYTFILRDDDIIFNEDDIDENNNEEDSYENGFNESINKVIRRFTIRKKNTTKASKKNNKDDFDYYEIESEVDLYITPYFERLLKNKAYNSDDGTYELSLKSDIQLEEELFYVEIENTELSSILNKIISLINTKEHLNITTYNDMTSKFIELCNNSNIFINSVHLEIIIRELIKDVDNVLERPDFSIKDPKYQIMRLADSILNSNSVVTSISFERFKEQIYKPRTYRKKGKSLLDNFFI